MNASKANPLLFPSFFYDLREHGFEVSSREILIFYKGLIKIATINKMHEMLMSQLALDDIKLCPHLSEDKCNCRKPNPGMLLEAAKEYSINLKNSYMIGDRVSDIKAGEKAGCKCIFIDHGYAETESENFEINMIVKSLPEAVNLIKNSEN